MGADTEHTWEGLKVSTGLVAAETDRRIVVVLTPGDSGSSLSHSF